MTIGVCFHGIGICAREREPGESGYWMAESTFLRVLDAFVDAPRVALSFDDGNRSDVDIALPALRERGLTATFFPIAGRLDDPASLNAADLRELVSAKMTIGSHGWDHVSWQGLTDTAARREFVDSRATIETAAGVRIDSAACPLGRYDRRALMGLKAAGYQTVFTSDRFPSRDGSRLRARYSVTAADTAESVARIAHHRAGPGDAWRLGKSLLKRIR